MQHRHASINLALAALGSALGAARVYIFESHKESPMGHFLIDLGWEWTSAGVRQQIGEHLNFDLARELDACMSVVSWNVASGTTNNVPTNHKKRMH